MLRRTRVGLLAALAVLGSTLAGNSSPGGDGPSPHRATLSDKALSERVVAYDLEARVDAQRKSIDATETLTYRNLTGQPQDTFPFHLYLNAFQPKSTFMQESRRNRRAFSWHDKYRASIEIRSLEVAGMGDLTSKMRFVAPDDGNSDDRTVVQVKLPRAVPAGESVQFKISFHDQLGQVFARTGYAGDFMMGAQWFPKVGVWWQGAWNCHQFHSTTEFFSDFGTYDVRLTVPRNEVVGASGVEVSRTDNADGTKTVAFHGEDIHDFAWTIDPRYHVFTETFQGSVGPVTVRLLMQPEHVHQAERHMRILRQSLERFDRWYGPYPYAQITAVDPPHGGLRSGGMEYPTLFTCGTTWSMPRGEHLLEEVVEHEFGHQYWYGMVASNEFEDAWLDEGVNSYTEVKVLDDIFGQDRSDTDLAGMTKGDGEQYRDSYLQSADKDPIARAGYQYLDGSSYADITYSKTATVLLTLEKIIGEDTMRRALRTYFERFRFKHPTKEDFLKTLEEVSGQDLRGYFDQAIYGTAVLDYEIAAAGSDRLDWYEENPQRPREDALKKDGTTYRTTVVVHRKGDFVFPVETVVKFDNGEVVREHWDGRDRWVRYTYTRKEKLLSAEIDPEHAIGLDKNRFNNSFVVEPNSAASGKISRYWTACVQFVSQLVAWLA